MISTVLYNKGQRIEKMQRDWKVAFSFSASFLFSAGMIRKGILRNCERKREIPTISHKLPRNRKILNIYEVISKFLFETVEKVGQ